VEVEPVEGEEVEHDFGVQFVVVFFEVANERNVGLGENELVDFELSDFEEVELGLFLFIIMVLIFYSDEDVFEVLFEMWECEHKVRQQFDSGLGVERVELCVDFIVVEVFDGEGVFLV
jgi:hypothetical protein